MICLNSNDTAGPVAWPGQAAGGDGQEVPMRFVSDLGELILVQPLRTCVNAVARAMRMVRPRRSIGVSALSGQWLRQHDRDASKHGIGNH